jgi:hypothetical protein
MIISHYKVGNPKIMNHLRARSGILIAFLLFAELVAKPQTYVAGNSYFGRNNYIEYIAGNLPIIISVPHGGALIPSEIVDRTCGTETVTDSYTVNLAREIKDAINQITGCYPHIIINNLKRTKLDANRDLPEAACGNPFAETAWNEFQNFIDTAKANITKKSGKGLYIDLHGHGHSIQRLELGYLLTAVQLSYSDATLNTTTYKNLSSIRSLIYANAANLTHSELLHGSFSLGQMFAAKGFPSIPSADDMFPASGQLYFNGGYNTLRHGSQTSGTIDGIQIECNQDVRFIETYRLNFASNVALVILEYLRKHYFPNLSQTYCSGVHVDQSPSSEVMMFPNPFISDFYIQHNIPSDLRIYNIQGKLIYSKRIGTDEKLNLGHLKNGIYFITLNEGLKILYREKIIKESY